MFFTSCFGRDHVTASPCLNDISPLPYLLPRIANSLRLSSPEIRQYCKYSLHSLCHWNISKYSNTVSTVKSRLRLRFSRPLSRLISSLHGFIRIVFGSTVRYFKSCGNEEANSVKEFLTWFDSECKHFFFFIVIFFSIVSLHVCSLNCPRGFGSKEWQIKWYWELGPEGQWCIGSEVLLSWQRERDVP